MAGYPGFAGGGLLELQAHAAISCQVSARDILSCAVAARVAKQYRAATIYWWLHFIGRAVFGKVVISVGGWHEGASMLCQYVNRKRKEGVQCGLCKNSPFVALFTPNAD